MRLTASVLFISVLLVAGCAEDKPTTPIAPRPVQVLLLEETNPISELKLTGSAVSWRTEDIAFEVGGRVEWIVEQGTEVMAPWGPDNDSEATVIARIDSKRYQVAVDGATAAYESALAEKATHEAELNHVIPANLEAAHAKTLFSKAEVRRYEEAIKSNAVSKSDLDEKRASLDVSLANEKEIAAKKIATSARIKASAARAAMENENLRQAKINLDDCVLRTPYPAEVADVHAIPGAVVSAGQPACTLTVMNPIKIVVSLSYDASRRLKFGDAVRVYPPASNGKPHPGSVFYKSTTADPQTRTFQVEVITRNYKVTRALPDDPAVRALPRVDQVFYPVSISSTVERERAPGAVVSDDEAWYLNQRGIYGDKNSGFYVWRAKGVTRLDIAKLDSPVLTIERVGIELGAGDVDAFGLYHLREIQRNGSLKATDVIVPSVPEGAKDGDRVAYVRAEWLLRPGALVPVLLDTGAPPPGFYLPMNAVQRLQGGEPFVFVVEKDSAGGEKVRRVGVEIAEKLGERLRVTGPGISGGTRIVLDGAHYLVDGDAVSVADEVRSK